jgi:outer membrane protein TolC
MALRVALTALVCLVCWPQLSAAGGKALRPASYGYFDFPTCVRYALVHSDELTSNRIDIQLASMDVKDAHSELLPTLQIFTRYYLTESSSTGITSPFNVQLIVTQWNPYLALLKIKAGNILVDIAKITHISKISDDTNTIAKTFYGIASLERRIRAKKEMVALQRNKVNYGRSRGEQGNTDELELRTLENSLRGMQIDVKSLKNQREEQIALLKRMIGYPPDQYLPLDTRDAVKQILGGFNGETVTFPEIQANNLSLKILAKKEQLQSNYVTGAYVKLLPRPLIVFENVQNQPNAASGFNIALGLEYTLWDGFKAVRDIKRQKLNGRIAEIKRSEASQEIYGQFKKIRNVLQLAGEQEAYSREQAKLAELTEEKAFLGYKSGAEDYDQYMSSRIQKVQAQVDAMKSMEPRVLSLIDLATIAGGLNRYNAGIRY